MKIFVFGGASVDTIIHLENELLIASSTYFASNSYKQIGSTGVGKALALKKLGFDVTLHALNGDDEDGVLIKNYLRQEGIYFAFDFCETGTETHTNLMLKDGRRASIYTNSLSHKYSINRRKIEKLIDEADIIVLNIIEYTKSFIPYIKNTNKPVFVDIHDYDGKADYHKPFINVATHLFLSDENLEDIKAFVGENLSRFPFISVTSGKDGSSLYLHDKVVIKKNPEPVSMIVDTNGAGDNYFAGFLYAYLHHLDPKDWLLYGSIAAKLCIQSKEISSNQLSVDTISYYIQHRGNL